MCSSRSYQEIRDAMVFCCRLYRERTWRWGQAVWNIALRVHPTVVEPLRGGPLDPYYNNSVSDAFLDHVDYEVFNGEKS